jgi:hypothetical protein
VRQLLASLGQKFQILRRHGSKISGVVADILPANEVRRQPRKTMVLLSEIDHAEALQLPRLREFVQALVDSILGFSVNSPERLLHPAHPPEVPFLAVQLPGSSGALSLEEVQALQSRIFNYIDADKDGKLVPGEVENALRGGFLSRSNQ